MKRTSPKNSRASALLPALTAVFACILPLILAEIPAWWNSRGVVKTDTLNQPVAASDFAVANQGQLKNFAIAAYEEFLLKIHTELGGIGSIVPPPNLALPEGPANRASPGWRIRQLVGRWVQLDPATGKVLHADLNAQGQPAGTFSVNGKGPRKLVPGAGMAGGDASAPKDFAAINLGQIKAVAAPFYDRLAELYWSYNSATPATSQLDPAWAKPWTDSPGDANHHAMATLGQLKNVFAIDLDSDGDRDGLTNLAELLANRLRSSSDRSKWTDLGNAYSTGGQLTDGEQVTLGLDPTDPVNGLPPDAPTGLHIVFRDAEDHPEDPDLREIRVEWDGPTRAGTTVSFAETYAGNPGGWVPGLCGTGTSSDITVPFSKRVYEYRVTFTGPNNLTASSDIAYELPVIRGLMHRKNEGGFKFPGVLLYPSLPATGVPRKFRNYNHTWDFTSTLTRIDGDQRVKTNFVRDYGSYDRKVFLHTGSYSVQSEIHKRDTWSTDGVIDSESPKDTVFELDMTEPTASFPSGLASSSLNYDASFTGASSDSDEELRHLSFDLQSFQSNDAFGNSGIDRPFTNMGAYDKGHYFNDNLNAGTSSHHRWHSTPSLVNDTDRQRLEWSGYYDLSIDGGTPDHGTRNFGWWSHGLPHVSALVPGHLFNPGFIGPDADLKLMKISYHGENPPTGVTPTITPSAAGVGWTRTYSYASGTTYTEDWTETVTLTSEIETADLIDATVGTYAPIGTIGWYLPGQDPADRFTNRFKIDESGTSTYAAQLSPWLDWDYTSSYVSAARGGDFASAGYPVNGYVTIAPNISGLVGQHSLSADETSGELLSSEYKFRIYPPAESCELQWLETFDPYHAIIGPVQPQYKIRTCSVTAHQASDTAVQTVDRTQGFAASGAASNSAAPQAGPGIEIGPTGIITISGPLEPELYADLNNDGLVNKGDKILARLPYTPGASEAIRDAGTEFMFYNDTLSNGAWDVQDSNAPNNDHRIVDDDAEALYIGGRLPSGGDVWFDRGTVPVAFYTVATCSPSSRVDLSEQHPMTVSQLALFGNTVYVRAEGAGENPQVVCDLKLMVKPASTAPAAEGAKMRLSIVGKLGDTKFYHAVADYIKERNSTHYTNNLFGPTYPEALYAVFLDTNARITGINAASIAPRATRIHTVIEHGAWQGNTLITNCSYSTGPSTLLSRPFYDKFWGKLFHLGAWDASCSVSASSNPRWPPGTTGYILSAKPGKIEFGANDAPDFLPDGRVLEGTEGLHRSPGADSREWNCWAKGLVGDVFDIRASLIQGERFIIVGSNGHSTLTGKKAEFLTRAQTGTSVLYSLWTDPSRSVALALADPNRNLHVIHFGSRHGEDFPFDQRIKTYLGIEGKPVR